MYELELQDIARIEIRSGAAGDDRPHWTDIAEVHDLTKTQAKRVIELIDTATITIAWEG